MPWKKCDKLLLAKSDNLPSKKYRGSGLISWVSESWKPSQVWQIALSPPLSVTICPEKVWHSTLESVTICPHDLERVCYYITERKDNMSCLSSFLFLYITQPHRRSAIDFINTCLKETASKIRHSLITLRQLVTFHYPVYFERHTAWTIGFSVLAERFIQPHSIGISYLLCFAKPELGKSVLQTNKKWNQIGVYMNTVQSSGRAVCTFNEPGERL